MPSKLSVHSASHPTLPVGLNIRKFREAKLMKQLELAHAIGFKGPDAGAHISRIENGKTKAPRLETINRIAKALGVGIDTLLLPLAKQEKMSPEAPRFHRVRWRKTRKAIDGLSLHQSAFFPVLQYNVVTNSVNSLSKSYELKRKFEVHRTNAGIVVLRTK